MTEKPHEVFADFKWKVTSPTYHYWYQNLKYTKQMNTKLIDSSSVRPRTRTHTRHNPYYDITRIKARASSNTQS